MTNMDRAGSSTFNFVNLSHPDELKDRDTQNRIRRLAMTEVGKARRKSNARRSRNENVWQLATVRPPSPSKTVERLGAGEGDPFAAYPFVLDESARELVVYIFRQDSNHARLLRGSWWPVGLLDAATFNSVLCHSRLFVNMRLSGQTHGASEDPVSLSYHSKAVTTINRRMHDVNHHVTEETIAAVASFMFHDQIVGALAGCRRHREAVLRMLSLRGGLETITAEGLRITLSFADMCGAHALDISPTLPMPLQWIQDSRSPPTSPRPLSDISLVWKRNFPVQQDWISIFDDMTQLISLDRALTDEQVEAAAASGAWTEPTTWRLLSIRPLHRGPDHANLIEEVCRLGTLLFLAPIWRAMGASPVWTCSFSHNLLRVLDSYVVHWRELKPLLLWTLYFAGIETRDVGERCRFAHMLAVLMIGMHIFEWNGLMSIIKSVLWVEKIFVNSEGVLRKEVESHLVLNVPQSQVEEQDDDEPDLTMTLTEGMWHD